MRICFSKRLPALFWLFSAGLSHPALADWTAGTNAVVSNITHTSASFTASITTDTNGAGEYTLYFYVKEVGATAEFFPSATPQKILVAGNATTTFTATATSLACGRNYQVTGAYQLGTAAKAAGTAATAFSTLPCASISPASITLKHFLGTAIAPVAFTAANFNGTPTFQVTPALPAGLSFSASTGAIAGTPTTSQIETRHLIRGSGSVSGVATATVVLTVVPGLTDLDALRYIASHPDLIDALGFSVDKARQHYRDWGFNEGRKITFQPLYYTASHPDLISAFGLDEMKAVTHFIEVGYKQKRGVTFDPDLYLASNPALIDPLGGSAEKGVKHYIEWGYKEGRKTTGFDTLGYVASYPDLISAFGLDTAKALRHYIESGYRQGRVVSFDGNRYLASNPLLIAPLGASAASAVRHYIEWGYREGRSATSFDPLAYTASYPDLIDAFGLDTTKALRHYIEWGYKESRAATFKPLLYIASYPDLIAAFGVNSDEGAKHYIQWGYKAGRRTSFSALAYTASHPDLIRAFGANEDEAAKHYIQWGYREGRSTTFSDLDALQYVASFADLIQGIGSDVAAAIRHYLTTGYNAGRQITFDALAYIASYGDLISAFSTNALEGAKHYIQWGYREGRRIVFDALGYLAKHADLRAAFGTDLAAATKHYITAGFKENRIYDFSVRGNVQVSGIFQVDSDTNDPVAAQSTNNTLATAQVLVAPFVLSGHVNRVNAGNKDGRWYSSGDLDDVFRITLRKGQVAELQVAAEKQLEGDVRLELYDSQGILVAGIKPYGRRHSVAAPSDGEYFVAVRVASGASRYTLEVESFVPAVAAAISPSLFSDPEFVSGELLVLFKEKQFVSSKNSVIKSTSRSDESGFSALDDSIGEVVYSIKDDLGKNLYTVDIQWNSLGSSRSAKDEEFDLLISGGAFKDASQREKYLTVSAGREFSRDPAVTDVYLNHRNYASAVPNDPGYTNQRWHYEQINLPSAWDLTKGSSEVVVAVLDTGVIRHTDLVDNLLAGYDFVSSDPFGDGDGEDADPSDPGKFEESQNTPRRSHGTHVAGTVAARGNNGSGVSGVSWNTKILPVRVLASKDGGTTADIIKGMRYAAGLLTMKPPRVANIINLSLGGNFSCSQSAYQAVVNEVRAAGLIVVAANGNSKDKGVDFVGAPANCVGVVSVAATDPKVGTTYYSQEGPETDVAAPGGASSGRASDAVYSTDMYRIGSGSVTDAYQAINGTSMATPHVAGVISLMKAAKPALSPDEFDQLLAAGRLTRDIERCDSAVFSDGRVVRSNCQPGKDVASGYGLIDAYKAVEAVMGTPPAIQARIDVTPGRIDFGASLASTELYVTLVGDSPIPVTVTPSISSQPWLSLAGPVQVDRRTLRYIVSVNRAAVSNGVFEGLVTFRAATSSATLNTLNVPVYMSKPSTVVSGNAGLQYAVLIDPSTFKSVAGAAFYARESGAAFQIVGVARGSYYVVAGTDTDNNNFICEEGEICSIYEVLKGESDLISVQGPVARLILKPRVIVGTAANQGALSESLGVASNDSWIGIPRTGAVSPAAVRRLLPSDRVESELKGSDSPLIRGASLR